MALPVTMHHDERPALSLVTPQPLAIEARGLTKRDDGAIAVNVLDRGIPEGEVYGFLRPHGAGETTILRMLLGLIAPTSGPVA